MDVTFVNYEIINDSIRHRNAANKRYPKTCEHPSAKLGLSLDLGLEIYNYPLGRRRGMP